MLYGASPDDYFRYQFYRKNMSERRKFITWRRGKRLVEKYNSNQDLHIFNDKRQMNAALANYIGREWMDLSDATETQFKSFVNSFGQVLMKPRSGARGCGIFLLRKEECYNISLSDYREYIAEEFLVQHPILAELNETSVNTIRAMTFCGELISCVLKVGKNGAVVDNLHSQGIYGNINIKYGVTDSMFYDTNLDEYAFHPTSGARLIGIKIPHWEELKDLVHRAAKEFSGVQYIGWDCAVLPDKAVIIEANEAPGHELSCQSTKQEGIYGRIREIERKKKQSRVQ